MCAHELIDAGEAARRSGHGVVGGGAAVEDRVP